MAITLDGNSNVSLAFSSGGRITGDYTNATLLSRAMFQTSTANGSTGIYALPNGTSTSASWQATNAADPTNASKILIATNGSTDCQLVSGRNGTGTYLPLTFYTNGSEQMRLDTSGNFGLGVTPSGWNTLKGIQVSTTAYIAGFPSQEYASYGSNAYYASGWKYITTNVASQVNCSGGGVQFQIAPSGTAGNAISFTQAMTLDSSGNLLVGTTSSTSLGGISWKTVISGTANGLAIANSGTGGATTAAFQASNYTGGGANVINFYNGSGTLAGSISIPVNASTGTTTAYNVSSDERLKTNVKPAESAIKSILDFPVDQFDWISSGEHQDFGAVAQKAINVIPEMVSVPADPDEMWGIDWSKAVPRLIKTIQELTARLEALENK